MTFLAIVLGTFVSEDLTCIGTGVLIQRGEIGVANGIAACITGIFVGDVGLWAIGYLFGRTALGWSWLARRLRDSGLPEIGPWLERHAAGVIVGSRFLPGTRLPLYVMAGVVRMPAAVFAWWALVAAVLWSPTIVLLTATLGDAFTTRVAPFMGRFWPARIAAAGAALVMIRALRFAASPQSRRRVAARLARWSRWEFWPMWVFYAPVALWVALLSLRHRGVATLTAANPGMADGGTVGESKAEILAALPPTWTIPFVLVEPGEVAGRLDALRRHFAVAGWSSPIVFKPDVGQRGVGVKLARGWDDARDYFSRMTPAVIAQPYHPGPFEAGVFYYRFPGSARGRILSITDKRFPVIVGDAVSTVEELIWAHPRYRLQADTFFARHRALLATVLGAGERLQLAIAGNHAQGTLFCDGSHLFTAALEERIDQIARTVPGFFIGRFDIRYRDRDAFRAGTDVAIVELNGATSESTIIYDPATSLWSAYRQLCRQWSLVFAIGAANRSAGAPVSSTARLVQLVHAHLKTRLPDAISD